MTVSYELSQEDLRKVITEWCAKKEPGDIKVSHVMFHHTEEDRQPGNFYYSATVTFERRPEGLPK